MMESYLEILDKISLSSIDKETVLAFRNSPNSRTFLAISEILEKHGYEDDSMQLLMNGVHLHPSYSAARVVLAKKLFRSSLFQEAWDILEQSPTSLKENKTSQLLKFRLALILGLEEKLSSLRHDMEVRGQLDPALVQLNEELKLKSFDDVRRTFLQIAKAEGLQVDNLRASKPVAVEGSDVEEQSSKSEPEDATDPVLLNRLIEGFYVAPIPEIFNKTQDHEPDPEKHDLDAVTLAQVYRKQGRYQKSLEIYQRLLYMAPNNDLFKKQVEELKSLREEQYRQEQHLDPDLVERLDEIQAIDARVAVLNKLLARLDEYEAKKDF